MPNSVLSEYRRRTDELRATAIAVHHALHEGDYARVVELSGQLREQAVSASEQRQRVHDAGYRPQSAVA
jgi:hypothetical protein